MSGVPLIPPSISSPQHDQEQQHWLTRAVSASRRFRSLFALFVLLTATGIFHLLTLREGHVWGDDFALYIQHAANIAQGRPYLETGLVSHPHTPDYSPRAYPPVFPMMLAPIVATTGVEDLTPMKVQQVVFLLVALAGIYACFRHQLPRTYALTLVALIGFNPAIWERTDMICSDLLFLMFFFASLWVIEQSPRESAMWAALAGVLIYLCYGTRTAGFTLVPGFLVYEFIKYRRITRFWLLSVAVLCGLVTLQWAVLGPFESSYRHQFHPSISLIARNTMNYVSEIVHIWPTFAGPIAVIVSCLALVGAFVELKAGRYLVFCVLACYGALIVLWPAGGGFRFLLPIIPIYLAFTLVGLAHISARLQGVTLAILIVIVGAAYFTGYRRAEFGRITESIGSEPFKQMCDFIRHSTAPDDVLVFNRARLITLVTGRRAAIYRLYGTAEDYASQAADLERLRANYLIVGSGVFAADRQFLVPFRQRWYDGRRPVYQNAQFEVYRLR